MTIIDTELDRVVLDDLDFEIPCDAVRKPSPLPQCARPADWLVTLRLHCGRGIETRPVCDWHWQQAIDGADIWCGVCREGYGRVLDYVLNIERLKP